MFKFIDVATKGKIKMISLTDNQIKTIVNIYTTDPEVKALVDQKIQLHINAAKEHLARLQSFNQSKPKTNKIDSCKRSAPGSKGHREAIMDAVKSKPGLTIGELRQTLDNNKHNISGRVLASLVSTMRKEFSDTKGQKGLRAEGEKPNTRYFV